MIRSLMQVYVKNSVEALELYQKAFDAKIVSDHRHEDGTIYHAELDVYGQIVSLSEFPPQFGDFILGATMQFCLHFGKGNEHIVKKSYDILNEGALRPCELSEVDFSPLFFALTDKFGVNWCVFV